MGRHSSLSKLREIAAEWTRQTLDAKPEIVRVVGKMLMQSWPAYENYTGPLGMQTLTDITGSHYDPNIESSERNGWGQWRRADHDGVGMDRTVATGTGFAGQYPPEVAKIYESLATTPDELLLFFHHVPYTYRLHSGKTVIQHIYDSHYPGRLEAEDARLTGYKVIDITPWEDASGGKAVSCGNLPPIPGPALVQGTTSPDAERLSPGRALYQGTTSPDAQKLNPGRALYQGTTPKDAEKLSPGRALYQGTTPKDAEKLSPGRALYQGTTSKDAEKLSPGRALYQGTTSVVPKTAKNEAGALAPEGPQSCTAEWTYAGRAGRFNIAVQYFDLQGGAARFALKINGQPTAAWSADANLPSRRPNGDNSTRHTVPNVDLKPATSSASKALPTAPTPPPSTHRTRACAYAFATSTSVE